ncbi:alpha/beta fold hydrolase [candidate division KSB1 bacterium]
MENTFLFRNKNIHYRVEGKGDCIVLLHGFLESLHIWDYFITELCKTFQVICIDLPGHGKSECIEEVHTMKLMANVVLSVLNFLNVNQSVMIGHSMGGYVTLQFAEQYPEKLKGFGLFHSHAAADSEEAKKNRERTIDIIQKDHLGFISNFIPDLFAAENVQKYKGAIEILKKSAFQTPKEGIIAALKGMKERSSKINLLKNTSSPVLFIIGKEDKRIPIESIQEQIALPAHSETLILDKIGHMGYIEAQSVTLLTLKFFLNKIYHQSRV